MLGMAAALCLSGCLPGEEEVAKKYNNINQRTSIENTGLSLVQAANDMSAYLVAGNLVRRSPLDDLGVTTLYTVPDEDNPKPTMPAGIKVATCSFVPGDDLPDDHSQRKLSAVAYFVAQPKGIPALKTTSGTMAKVLSERFGGEAVGLVDGKGGVQYPKLAEDAECMPTLTDAIPFSPIFAAGFKYEGAIGTLIPDAKKTTWPSVYRDITIPCPAPYQGVVKREQHCRLITDESSVTPEEGVIDLASKKFGGKSENTIKRIEKTWDCDPPDGQTLTPTTEEIDASCRDPNAGLSPQADNTIQMNVDNIKELLDNGSGQYYTFKCRRNANGTNSCDTKPYNPNVNVPSGTFLRCDPQPVPEQYVINPIVPMQVDANGKVISETPNAAKTGAILGNRSCGQGWTGDLIAGYQVRACRLIKVVNGVQTPMKLAQTVYKIGYVGARCRAPAKEETYFCPRPFYGNLTLRESNYMTKPLALQLGTAPAGSWTPSTIPWSIFGIVGNANTETRARAAAEGYKISRYALQGMSNPTFSSRLEATMQPDMKKEIDGCKLAGQACEYPPSPIKLGIVFDRSGSMKLSTSTTSSNRMDCRASLGDIFTDQVAACGLLDDNARGEYPSDGRVIEGVLSDYLIDRSSGTLNAIMVRAINNKETCGQSITNQIGFCSPGGGANQGTCVPGTCVLPCSNPINGSCSYTDTKLKIAEEQLQVAVNYIPPGSEVSYTEYVDRSPTSPQPPPRKLISKRELCDTVTSDTCDHAKQLDGIRNEMLVNSGRADADTPLMEATRMALEEFDPDDKGILLYFTDGAQTDGARDSGFKASYGRPYGSLCGDYPSSSMSSSDAGDFCRAIGLTENNADVDPVDVLDMFEEMDGQYKCDTPDENPDVCRNIRTYYDEDGRLRNNWKNCITQYGTTNYPSVVDYIKANYPNLKVFILNLGDPELLACPREGNVKMIPVDEDDGYKKAFIEAFEELNTRGKPDPEEVCQRVRSRSYPAAASY
ncbi:MAG TPA: hypothetical protein VGF14_04585 [Alphaproteobacteria bacterium]